jgi:hypothetical protein
MKKPWTCRGNFSIANPADRVLNANMNMKTFIALSVSALLCSMPAPIHATSSADVEVFKKNFQTVRAPELPARAAELVSQTKPEQQEPTAEAVVRAALNVRPASGPAVVGAISRAVPSVAAVTAATAAELQPRMLGPIVKAAAAAAPEHAGAIVYRVAKTSPKQYRLVAIAAAEGAPQASSDILAALGSALPNLQPGLQAAAAKQPAGKVSVPAVLAQIEPVKPNSPQVALAAPPPPQPVPIVGEPFTPGGGTPGEIKREDTVIVTPGSGRDYSRP